MINHTETKTKVKTSSQPKKAGKDLSTCNYLYPRTPEGEKSTNCPGLSDLWVDQSNPQKERLTMAPKDPWIDMSPEPLQEQTKTNPLVHVMTSTDSTLHHCVELTCPQCGHMIRVARCQCDLDADHLVAVYQRDILLYSLTCPKCHKAYDDPESVQAVNRVQEDTEGVIDANYLMREDGKFLGGGLQYSLTIEMAGEFPGSPERFTVPITDNDYERLFDEFVQRKIVRKEAPDDHRA